MAFPVTQKEIERAAAQLSAGHKIVLNLKPEETGLLVVDVQRQFCDPHDRHKRGTTETAQTAQNIARLLPAFRAAGVKIYFVRTDSSPLFAVEPCAQDRHLYKSTNGAFDTQYVKDVLLKDGKKNLLVCGFNLNACVRETAHGAVNNAFRTFVAADMVGNDNHHPSLKDTETYLKMMLEAGIKTVHSKKMLSALRKCGRGKAVIS
jgi:nicotinamidase-related amidase